MRSAVVKINILLITIFILLLPLRLLAEEISLSLDEAISIALRDNRDVLLKIEEVKKAKEKLAEAKSGLLPTLNFTGSRTRTRGLYAKDLNQSSAQATLKQYLYKGGKTVNTIKENKAKIEVSEALLDKEKLETVLKVRQVFYTLLLAGELTRLNKKILENTESHLDFIKDRYAYGQVSESDVLSIEAQLGNVKEAYESSLSQLEGARALLNNLLCLEESAKIRPNAEFNYEPVEIAYDQAFLKAQALRPEIRQYEAQAKADLKAIEVAKSDTRPNIYASWDYYSRSTTSLTFSPSKAWQDYNILSTTFTWPVFDGWATKAKVEQAIIDLKETKLMQEKTKKDIALELKNAYLALKDAIAKIKSVESDIIFYKDKLAATKEKYAQGQVSSLELEDVVLSFEVELFNQKQSVYDYLMAKCNFEKATGG